MDSSPLHRTKKNNAAQKHAQLGTNLWQGLTRRGSSKFLEPLVRLKVI